MSIESLYQGLTAETREALNEAIMDKGINSYESLLDVLKLAHDFIVETNSKLTFEKFIEGKRKSFLSEDDCGYEGGCEAWVYAEGCFIIIKPSEYWLIIENNEWDSNDLESLERILYENWYL